MGLKKYKYRVRYLHAKLWWDKDWLNMADWCNQTFGSSNWNYIDESFCFLREADQTLFTLKWL